MSIFKGSGVALATPMKENGAINYDSFEKLIEAQIAGGTDALIVCEYNSYADDWSEKHGMIRVLTAPPALVHIWTKN